MIEHDELLAQAARWAETDPDGETRAELEALVADGGPAAIETLQSYFGEPLRFGTAGLRAALGPGPGRFNVALVARLAGAVGAWLAEKDIAGPVVIGFDARHKSATAAREAAGVLSGMGREVFVAETAVPTPFVAFAAKAMGAAAAMVVTASHNPRTDNGVKVFGPDARQIITPVDTEIAGLLDEMRAVPAAAAGAQPIPSSVWESYVSACAAMAVSDRERRGDVKIAYTPVHGVGLEAFAQACDKAGFSFETVEAQSAPDPDFPTAAFPNPEEPGVLDLVLELATRTGADVAIANDPDADRLAAAVSDGAGAYRVLTGDELGAVLLSALLERGSINGSVASTVVSSELPSLMCKAFGVPHVLTPTGFKHLSRAVNLAFAYEESIGYCVDPESVRDKDGISAGVLLADMYAAGQDPLVMLERIDAAFGAHVQGNFSLRISQDATKAVLEALLSGALHSLGGLAERSIEDMAHDPVVAVSGVRLRFSDDEAKLRLIVRPSGTEPKTKFYVEAVHPDRSRAEHLARTARAEIEQFVAGLA